MKIHKTVATRAVPFGPDMHQIVCRLAPDPTGGAYSAPPDPGLRGPTSKGGEARAGEERGGEERGVEGREGKESVPLDLNPGDATGQTDGHLATA